MSQEDPRVVQQLQVEADISQLNDLASPKTKLRVQKVVVDSSGYSGNLACAQYDELLVGFALPVWNQKYQYVSRKMSFSTVVAQVIFVGHALQLCALLCRRILARTSRIYNNQPASTNQPSAARNNRLLLAVNGGFTLDLALTDHCDRFLICLVEVRLAASCCACA